MRKAVYKIRRYLFGLSVMGAVASSPATLSGQVRAEGNGGGKEKSTWPKDAALWHSANATFRFWPTTG